MTGPNPVSLASLREERGTLLANVQALSDKLKEEEISDAEAEDIQTNIDAILNEGGKLSLIDRRIGTLEKVEAATAEAARKQLALQADLEDKQAQIEAGIRPKFVLPATCRRHALKGFQNKVIDGQCPEERAYSLGMWLMYRLSCDLPGRYNGDAFTKAREYCAQRGMTKGKLGSGILNALPIDSTEAGIGNVETFSADMVALFEQYGIARQVFKNQPIPDGGTVNFPKNATRLQALFIDEGAAITSSEATYTNETITPKRIAGITAYTREIGQDNIIGLANDLAMQLAWATAQREDFGAFAADGTADTLNGGFTGLLPALLASGNVITGAAGGWPSFTMDDFTSVIGLLPQFADTPNTAWLCSKQFQATVMQPLLVAAGGNTITDIQDGARRLMFLGYPVIVSQTFPTATAVDQVACTLGDYSMGARYATKMEIEVTFSETATVDALNLWQQGLVGVRSMERWGVNVHDVDPGGPIAGLQTAPT